MGGLSLQLELLDRGEYPASPDRVTLHLIDCLLNCSTSWQIAAKGLCNNDEQDTRSEREEEKGNKEEEEENGFIENPVENVSAERRPRAREKAIGMAAVVAEEAPNAVLLAMAETMTFLRV